MLPDYVLEGGRRDLRHVEWPDLSAALHQRHHHLLLRTTATWVTVEYARREAVVHQTRLAANVCFVHFHDAVEWARVVVRHRVANPMHHEQRRLVGEPGLALDL